MTTDVPGPLVSAEWLRDAIATRRRGLVVADVRWYLTGESGRAAYEQGHVPGAVWVDLDHDCSAHGAPGPGRHPLPSPEAFADALHSHGIGEGSTVVAYDDASGSVAARLWWMLDAQGITAAVLDGGIAAWTRPGSGGDAGTLERGSARTITNTAPRLQPRPWPIARLADALAVDALRRCDPGVAVVLDARSAARFRGDPNPVDPRPGHIPGAVNAPWAANTDAADGRFLAPVALRERFAALGIDDRSPRTIVSSCGSGVTACHNLLALRVAGLDAVHDVRLYPGSYSDWQSDPTRPVATGD